MSINALSSSLFPIESSRPPGGPDQLFSEESPSMPAVDPFEEADKEAENKTPPPSEPLNQGEFFEKWGMFGNPPRLEKPAAVLPDCFKD